MARDQRAYFLSRRSFCCTLTGILVAPGIAIAQASKAVRRIGFLSVGMPLTPEEIQEFGGLLRELGWVDGRNLHVEWRYANGKGEALQALAEELIRANVEVIVTKGTTATLAAKRATGTGCADAQDLRQPRGRRRHPGSGRPKMAPGSK